MYARAVWKEGVVPENWTDRTKRIVRWAQMSTTKTEKAIKEKLNPQDDWMTFPLIKIKMTASKYCFDEKKMTCQNILAYILLRPQSGVSSLISCHFAGLPNVIGCIDGTQIPITAPTQNEGDYVNRKCFHSINVQIIRDAASLITNVEAKWPGSVHDSRIYRECSLSNRFARETESGRWTFALPWDVYQKKILGLLVDLCNQYKTAQHASSTVHIERMDTMEDLERERKEAFDTLVKQIAKIGRKNTKDCVHKVLDRLFTKALVANFNMKCKGKKGKEALEMTSIYRTIQDGVMQFDKDACFRAFETCTTEGLHSHSGLILF
ncbi:hypothetical protein JOB18_040751 [Solea senegalensis]|uniref:DDE Tnp4 domain-containing protein n=1 Tax=Solea senegalensis TaxID=28829 RepID=A0AAV6SU18_SOLSE|nr:hypothetical protein JOB18_040751 [Solea senegalensis]